VSLRRRQQSYPAGHDSETSVRHGAPSMPGNHDFSTSRAGIVPRDHRRPMWHFTGLWTTLVAGFSFMVPGFVMYDGGFSWVPRPVPVCRRWRSSPGPCWGGSARGCVVAGEDPGLGWVSFQADVLLPLWHGFYGWPQAQSPAPSCRPSSDSLGCGTGGSIPLESWLAAGTCYLALTAAVRHKAASPSVSWASPLG